MPPGEGTAVTIGAYDGVHLGHRALLRDLSARAAAAGLQTVVVTFDRHPAAVVRPESAPKQLTGLEQKLELLADCGVDLKPFADGPTVRALKVELVRAEFCKGYYAEGDTPKKVRDAKLSAFKRAIDTGIERKVIMLREIADEQFVWLAAAPTAETPAAMT